MFQLVTKFGGLKLHSDPVKDPASFNKPMREMHDLGIEVSVITVQKEKVGS